MYNTVRPMYIGPEFEIKMLTQNKEKTKTKNTAASWRARSTWVSVHVMGVVEVSAPSPIFRRLAQPPSSTGAVGVSRSSRSSGSRMQSKIKTSIQHGVKFALLPSPPLPSPDPIRPTTIPSMVNPVTTPFARTPRSQATSQRGGMRRAFATVCAADPPPTQEKKGSDGARTGRSATASFALDRARSRGPET